MGKCAILALALLVALLATPACKAPEESHSKAILGAVLIDGSGGPPLTNSMVVMAGDHIRGAGRASTIPIPAQADKIDGGGRFLVPALVAVTPNIQGRDEAAFAKAREAGLPAIGRVATLADAEWMLDHGATGFVGMIRDTETLDPDFLAKLRDLRITCAPALIGAGGGGGGGPRGTPRPSPGGRAPVWRLPGGTRCASSRRAYRSRSLAKAPTRCARPSCWRKPAFHRST